MSSLKTWKFSLGRTKIFNHSQEILERESLSIKFLLNRRMNFQVLWAIFILIKISRSVKGDRIISEVIIKWDNNFWMNALINLIIKWNSILLIRLLTESLEVWGCNHSYLNHARLPTPMLWEMKQEPCSPQPCRDIHPHCTDGAGTCWWNITCSSSSQGCWACKSCLESNHYEICAQQCSVPGARAVFGDANLLNLCLLHCYPVPWTWSKTPSTRVTGTSSKAHVCSAGEVYGWGGCWRKRIQLGTGWWGRLWIAVCATSLRNLVWDSEPGTLPARLHLDTPL